MFLPAVAFAGAHLTARVADEGLSNFLGLDTLRHGTNPISWIGIHTLGAMPRMGNSKIGGDHGHGFEAQNRGRFYLAQDTDNYPKKHYQSFTKKLLQKIEMRFMPHAYSVTSNYNTVKFSSHKYIAKALLPFEIGVGLCLPSIKFRISPEKVSTFTPDQSHKGKACSTDRHLGPWNIGVIGTIWNSLSYKTPIRMVKNPTRVVAGTVQLAIAGVIIYHALTIAPAALITYKVAIIAGAALAVV